MLEASFNLVLSDRANEKKFGDITLFLHQLVDLICNETITDFMRLESDEKVQDYLMDKKLKVKD